MGQIRDSFDRADDPTGLGAADIGGLYTREQLGAPLLGILGDQAYVATPPAFLELIQETHDIGSPDHYVEATVDAGTAAVDAYGGLALRCEDATADWMGVTFSTDAGGLRQLQVFQIDSLGAATELRRLLLPLPQVFRLRAEAQGNRLSVYAGGELVLGPLPIEVAQGSNVGLFTAGLTAGTFGATRWDDHAAGPLGLRTGPCQPWATTADLSDCCDTSNLDPAVLDDSLQVASEVLWELSRRQFSGLCVDTVRPCARSSSADAFAFHGAALASWPWAGWIPSWGTCGCQSGRSCGCSSLPEITLGGYPLRSIDEVRIDGAVLDPSAYRIEDSRFLARVDGEGWPCCQDLTADPFDPDNCDNTWAVTFRYGNEPPASGRRAAAVLACELAKSCTPGEACQLPSRVTSITRQGVTAVLLDPFDFLDNGSTGLYEVDLFLKSRQAGRVGRRATVASPDIGRRVRRSS